MGDLSDHGRQEVLDALGPVDEPDDVLGQLDDGVVLLGVLDEPAGGS